jgi:hypothetical protein
MELKCPHCGSIIYSRRNPLCGVCAQPLPPELLFNAEERAKVERDLEETERRRKQASSGEGDSSSGADFDFPSSTDITGNFS